MSMCISWEYPLEVWDLIRTKDVWWPSLQPTEVHHRADVQNLWEKRSDGKNKTKSTGLWAWGAGVFPWGISSCQDAFLMWICKAGLLVQPLSGMLIKTLTLAFPLETIGGVTGMYFNLSCILLCSRQHGHGGRGHPGRCMCSLALTLCFSVKLLLVNMKS